MHIKTLNITLFLTVFAVLSCASTPLENKKTTEKENVTKSEKKKENFIKSFTYTNKLPIKRSEKIEFQYKISSKVDSASLIFDGKSTKLDLTTDKITLNSDTNIVGSTKATLNVYKAGEKNSRNLNIKILPEKAPQEYTFEVKSVMTHPRDSYTQGLEFYKGKLYESSGEYDVSYLEMKEFPSLKSIKKKYLDPKYFAEGLTFLNDKLYLLTWKENTAFRINPETLEIEKEFSLSTEGWGLTTDGKVLYLSDGSEKIYKVNAENFSIIESFEVVTSEGSINSINEMEWIDGKIWANVYGYNVILIIDPNTGEATGIIRMPELLQAADKTSTTDVLNGIAKDPKTGKIYITGKNWPKMFEVELKKEL